MQVQVKLTGTQFGVAPPKVPMPSNLTLANDGFVCPAAAMQGSKAASGALELMVKDNVNFTVAFTACKIALLTGVLLDTCAGGAIGLTFELGWD
ncbi:hypothetical protein COP2_012458 [Malus domestica]